MACTECDPCWLEEDHYGRAEFAALKLKTFQNEIYDSDLKVWGSLGGDIATGHWDKLSCLQQFYEKQREKIVPLKKEWEEVFRRMDDSGLQAETTAQAVEIKSILCGEVMELEKILCFIDGVDSEIHMGYRTVQEGLDRISMIAQILMIPYNYQLAWVENGNFTSIVKLAEEMSSLSDEVNELSVQILADWEEEILSFDCGAIYDRFKVDYTSFFKRIGGQYKADKRTMMAMKKNVGKKLDDVVCLAGLELLRRYQKEKELFDNRSAEAAAVLGGYFRGLDTDWTLVRDVLESCRVINDYYERYGITPELAGLLGNSYDVRRYSKLNGMWAGNLQSDGMLQKYHHYIEPYGNEDLAGVIEHKKEQIASVDAVLTVRDAVIGYLDSTAPWEGLGRKGFLSEDASLGETGVFFGNVMSVEEKLGQYLLALQQEREQFPMHYRGVDTDWEYIGVCLEKAALMMDYVKEETLTEEQISYLKMHAEERGEQKICGIPVKTWIDDDHRSTLLSVWKDSGESADQLADRWKDSIHAIENANGIASEMAACFCCPEEHLHMMEVSDLLKKYF
ncbi:MAG: hypothetical protein LUF92_15225 [Clostridiales bacterium]|nr:hypothetical protein [Clostridiales bacterium]